MTKASNNVSEQNHHQVDNPDQFKPASEDSGVGSAVSEFSKAISVISARALERECISTSLRHIFPKCKVHCYRNPQSWEEDSDAHAENEVVLYSLDENGITDDPAQEDLRRFVKRVGDRKVIVLSKSDDLDDLFNALDCGAASYIPPNVGLNDLIEAMRMSANRSVVVPRKSIMALRGAAIQQETKGGLERHFTVRQLAVARALQQGSANKTIAFELGLRESTVKVHIRNIMRKLKATNRTQAAFKLNELAKGNLTLDVCHE